MPEMNGHQLTVEIKKKSPGTPVIMVTGSDERFLQQGFCADQLLHKPCSLSTIGSSVFQVLKGKEICTPA